MSSNASQLTSVVAITPDPSGASELTQIRKLLAELLGEIRVTNRLLIQLKDAGPMDTTRDVLTNQSIIPGATSA